MNFQNLKKEVKMLSNSKLEDSIAYNEKQLALIYRMQEESQTKIESNREKEVREILSVLYIERDKRKKDDRITPKRLTPEQKEKLIRENEQMLNNVKEALEYLKAIVEKIEDNQTKINTDRIRHDDY